MTTLQRHFFRFLLVAALMLHLEQITGWHSTFGFGWFLVLAWALNGAVFGLEA